MNASAFAGCIGAGEAFREPAAARMLGSAGGAADPKTWAGDGWALAVRAGVPALRVDAAADGGLLLVAGNPGHRGAAMDVQALCQQASADTPALDGSYLLLNLQGGARRRLSVLLDRFASYRFYYAQAGDGLVFASDPQMVVRHPAIAARISPQALYDFLYLSTIPLPESVFEGVHGAEPASSVRFSDGKLTCRCHWHPSFHPQPIADRSRTQARLRELLLDSVRRDIVDASTTGCFLSGGLDSSSVVGMVREATGEAPRTFTIGFATEGYDELDYARLVSRHFGTTHHEYLVTPDDIITLLPEVADAYGQPFGNSSVVPTWHCARLARGEGVALMLAGDGGDELFGGNERYAEQLVFGLYDAIPGWLRAAAVDPALPMLDRAGAVPMARKAASYIRQARLPMPDRLERYNYLRLIGEERILDAEFLAQVDRDRPLALKRAVYAAVDAQSVVNRMLGLDFKFTLADSDLPKVRTMCAGAGIEVRFPFLADELVDFAAPLPVTDKVTRRQLRGFYKATMRDFLPPQVIAKQKHGFGLPFGLWLTSHAPLRELAYSLLDGSAARGLVRRGFVDELKDSLVPEQPRYYGPLVWLLVVAELWHQRHEQRETRI